MRSTDNTILDSELFDINKQISEKIDCVSHNIVNQINQEINEEREQRLWIERVLYEECYMKPEIDYTIIKCERIKKNGI